MKKAKNGGECQYHGLRKGNDEGAEESGFTPYKRN